MTASVEPSTPTATPAVAPATPTTPPLSLDILRTVWTLQQQHGLRHGDYASYARYCTRRLRTLRRSLGATCGNKRRYAKRVLTADACAAEPRNLLVPLIRAERAWAVSMDLKEEDGGEQNPRSRHHARARLAKAASVARELDALVQARGDARTRLEAEAYVCAMQAALDVVRKQWAPALTGYQRARTIYAELAKLAASSTGSGDDQAYVLRLEQLDPSVRYCRFNLEATAGAAAVTAALAAAAEKSDVSATAATAAPTAGDDVRAHGDSVLAEARRTSAKAMGEIQWQGTTVAIRNDKVSALLLRVRDTLAEADSATPERRVELYDQLFALYNDAARLVRDEANALRKTAELSATPAPVAAAAAAAASTTPTPAAPATAPKPKAGNKYKGASGASLAQLDALLQYISYEKLHHTAQRNLLLLDAQDQRRADALARLGRAPKAADHVHLCDTLVQNYADLGALLDAAVSADQANLLAARAFLYRAYRAYHLATSFSAVDKDGAPPKLAEALGLLSRADEHLARARDHYKAVAGSQPDDDQRRQKALVQRIEGERVLIRLAHLTQAMEAPAPVVAEPTSLAQRLDTYDSGAVQSDGARRLICVPPEMEPIPARPLLFDVALELLEPPSLEHLVEKKEEKKGFFSGWFGK